MSAVIKIYLFACKNPMLCEHLFNDRRVVSWLLMAWTVITAVVFFAIMHAENSPFLVFGPNNHSKLFGVKLDNWGKWWCVAIYTFVSLSLIHI